MTPTERINSYQKVIDLLMIHYQAHLNRDPINQGTMFMCDLFRMVFRDDNPYWSMNSLDTITDSMQEFMDFEPTREEKTQVFYELKSNPNSIAFDAWLPMFHFEIRYTILLLCIEICKSSINDNAFKPD